MTDAATRLSASLADRYLIERELGQGGMATVYLAQDVRHDRKVALKVLRPELSAILGGERFLHEIKTTANLQHPHILSLFDSGEADGLVFYVMPYVDGESLRDRLNREKQLPVEEAVRIAREVADALHYAHQHGIVHRDIKPENILLHGGHAQVADFGIALAASRSDGGTRMTETGMSLGTPHYMSPEQAMGEREITPKADIYALGCVLYEMLTAEPPFNGATAQAIIARVMTEEPRSLTLQRRSIPPHVEAAVRTALEKLPADRFASAAQFGEALGRTDYAIPATRAAVAARMPRSRRQQALAAAPWALLVVVAGLLAWDRLTETRPVPPPVTRFPIRFSGGGEIGDAPGSPIAVSPDGARIVYVGRDSGGSTWLYSRNLDRPEPVQIAGTDGGAHPFFSPDGLWLGFQQDNRLRKVSLAGGAVVTICECPGAAGSWGPGDVIVFGSNNTLFRVSAAGGRPDTLARPDSAGGDSYRWPDLLPDGQAVLFTLVRQGVPSLAAFSLSDSAIHELDQPGMYPRYVEGGFLVFVQQDGTMFGAPFDTRRLRLAGAPVPIADDVRFGPAYPGKLGVARTGTIAYMGGQVTLRELVIAERDGRLTAVPMPTRFYADPQFSPDGQRIALSVLEFSARTATDLWTWDFRTRNLTRLTFDSVSSGAEWAPDGRRLFFLSRRGRQRLAVHRIATDGSGTPESLLVRPGNVNEVEVSADGRFLVFRENTPQTREDVWMAPIDSPQAARPLMRTPFAERGIALSPDGRWLAYTSNEASAEDVYVRRLEEGSGHWRVSQAGGAEPRWGAGGRELLFRNADSVIAVPFTAGPEPSFGAARAVLVGRFNTNRTAVGWDVSPDGRRFVFTRTMGERGAPTMHVVLNWFDHLKAQRR